MNKTEGDILYIIEKLGCATERQVGLIAAFVHGLDIAGMNAQRCVEILQSQMCGKNMEQ